MADMRLRLVRKALLAVEPGGIDPEMVNYYAKKLELHPAIGI
jgi:hypothetical protein